MKNARAKCPTTLRNKPARSARTVAKTSAALGLSTAMIMPINALSADNETVLEATRVVDTVIDPNPNAQANVPYKARTSGDDRHAKPLAETPQTISVITAKQLEDSGTTDLRDILQSQPGITLGTGENGNAFGDRYIIRGQEARSDVFVDGLRDPGMTVRESFATEQVEITKGASSTFAGRGSTGGAVNSITKQATTDLDFAKLSAGFGTDEFRRYTFDGNRVLSDTMAVRLNLLDAYREIPDRSPADRDREGAALSFLWKPTDKLDVVADYYHLKAEDKPDMGDYIDRTTGKVVKTRPYLQDEDFLKSSIDTYTLRVGYQFTPDVRLENLTRYGTTRNGYVTTGYRGTTLSTHQGWQDVEYFANALNLHVKQELFGMKHQFMFGAEYSDHSVLNGVYQVTNTGVPNSGATGFAPMIGGVWLPNANSLMGRVVNKDAWDSDWNVKTLSLSAMDTVDVTDKWTVFGGLRYDRFDYSNTVASNATNPLTRSETTYKLDDGLWNGHLGVTYKFLPYANVYANYSTASDFNGGESDVGASCDYGGICVPAIGTVSDRVRIFAGSKPEKTQSFELGTKWDLMGGRLLATAAAFRTEKSDVMETTSATSYNDIGTINTGKYRIQGVEFGLTGKLTDKLMLQAGYAVMKSKILESQNRANVGETLSNFPDQSASLLASYELTPQFTFGGGLTYSSKKYSGTPEGVAATALAVPEYTVFDLFAAYKITKQLNARLNVINVADKDYYTAAYRSGSFAYKGEGRNVRLTLDYNF